MSPEVKITIKNLQKKIPISPKEVRKIILKTLYFERIKKEGEITVCFVGDKKIRELNKKFLNKNEATDVLAFDGSTSSPDSARDDPERVKRVEGALTINPERSRRIDMLKAPEPKRIFADIIISTDTALRNAKVFRTDISREINLYLIHGILHLLGYDDYSPRDKKLMRDKEKEYVNR